MKKLLILMTSFIMITGLVGCSDDANVETSQAQQKKSTVDEQMKADEDYAKLESFLDRVVANYQDQQALAVLLEEVKNGQKEESALLDEYKQLAEDANGMVQDVKNTEWETNYYDDKVKIMKDCVEALASYQQTAYEASLENDDEKFETLGGLFEDYDAKLTALLDTMGVE